MTMKNNYLTQSISLLFIFLTSTASAEDKIEKTYNLADFTKIYLKGPYEVYLRQSEKCGLTILAQSGYFEKLEVSSAQGILEIELDGKNFKKTNAIEIYIQFNRLEKLEIEGAVDLQCENRIKSDNLKIEFEGAGNVELDVQVSKIIANISGVGNFEIEGKADYHKVAFRGIGNYEAQDLISKYTIVESYGIGSVSVYAGSKLKGEASGIGSIDYYGNPDEVDLNATGLGSVNRH